jgi:hypothetical protein
MTMPGKGILAMDESNATCGGRLEGVGVENIEENRRRYRELLITAPNLGEHIGGAILFEETLYQSCADGTSFVDALKAQGIYPGIKVDKVSQQADKKPNTPASLPPLMTNFVSARHAGAPMSAPHVQRVTCPEILAARSTRRLHATRRNKTIPHSKKFLSSERIFFTSVRSQSRRLSPTDSLSAPSCSRALNSHFQTLTSEPPQPSPTGPEASGQLQR